MNCILVSLCTSVYLFSSIFIPHHSKTFISIYCGTVVTASSSETWLAFVYLSLICFSGVSSTYMCACVCIFFIFLGQHLSSLSFPSPSTFSAFFPSSSSSSSFSFTSALLCFLSSLIFHCTCFLSFFFFFLSFSHFLIVFCFPLCFYFCLSLNLGVDMSLSFSVYSQTLFTQCSCICAQSGGLQRPLEFLLFTQVCGKTLRPPQLLANSTRFLSFDYLIIKTHFSPTENI